MTTISELVVMAALCNIASNTSTSFVWKRFWEIGCTMWLGAGFVYVALTAIRDFIQ